MRTRFVLIIATAALVATALPAASQTAAVVCAAKPVKAAGGVAVLEGAARSKARAAWIRKVTQSRRLGPTYAAWLRAQNATYACRRQGRHHVCDAIAVPCKI